MNDHVAPFDTDDCLACHDYSGGHTSVIADRVHAVHSSNSYGDMSNALGSTSSRNWDEITYPVQIDRCTICHISGNPAYRSVVGEVACLGCHGDNPSTGGATNHMLQNGGGYPVAP